MLQAGRKLGELGVALTVMQKRREGVTIKEEEKEGVKGEK